MFKKLNFKKYFLTTVFTVISLFANNLLFSFNQREENELLNNKELFNNVKETLQKSSTHMESYLNSIHELKNTAKETQISEFMQNSENKLSYYLKTSLVDGYIATTDSIKNKLIMSFIPMIPSIFKGSFLSNVEVFNELLRKTFSMQTYKSWKFVATFASQLAIGRLPGLLRLGGSIGLSIAATKLLGIPYTTFNMAMIPFRGIMEMEKSIQIQYKEKQNFKNNILQRFYSLNVLLSQLKELSQIIESNENLKPLTVNIKKLVDYNQDDLLGNFLTLIKNVENYENYKNKDFIQALYKTYISIFIKMENPEYKKLITNALKEFEQIESFIIQG